MSLMINPFLPMSRQRYGGAPDHVEVFKGGAAAICDASGLNILCQENGAVLFRSRAEAAWGLVKAVRDGVTAR